MTKTRTSSVWFVVTKVPASTMDSSPAKVRQTTTNLHLLRYRSRVDGHRLYLRSSNTDDPITLHSYLHENRYRLTNQPIRPKKHHSNNLIFIKHFLFSSMRQQNRRCNRSYVKNAMVITVIISFLKDITAYTLR